MFVVPSNKAQLVRDPISMMLIPEQGMEVPNSQYYRRRIADGSIKVGKPPSKNVKPSSKKEEK